MNIQIYLLTWFNGRFVGKDDAGNKYYESRFTKRYGLHRRWVIYAQKPEASLVPPAWHAWLHHMSQSVPSTYGPRPWEKPHHPNLTGTPESYSPRKKANTYKSYEPWKP